MEPSSGSEHGPLRNPASQTDARFGPIPVPFPIPMPGPARRPAHSDPEAPSPSGGKSGGARRPDAAPPPISAYPATITFHDLIRSNRAASRRLIVLMILLNAVLGAVIAAAVWLSTSASPDADWTVSGNQPPLTWQDFIPSMLLGCGVGLVVAALGTLWSWFSGSSAILSMLGAKEISRDLDRELFNVIDEVSIAAGLPMPRVFLIPESAMNAFATGRDPAHAAVAITTGLRQRLTREELQAVMAHEVAHIRHLDIRFAMLMATLAGLIVFACDAFLRMSRHLHRGGDRRDKGGGAIVAVVMIIALLLAIVAPIIARLIQMAYSREREYLADAGAVELTRNPQALANALSKLSNDPEPLVDRANRGAAHLFIVNPLRKMREAHQSLDSMFCSHPPVQKRIERLLALVR